MAPAYEPPLLAVDIGNSSIEFGAFRGNISQELPRPSSTIFLPLEDSAFAELTDWLPVRCQWCIATVNQPAYERLTSWLGLHRPDDKHRRLTRFDFPLRLQVETPDRVGVDRLAAVTAANLLRQEDRPAIVIDGGTAITVNLISGAGDFCGGAILPGFRLSASALANNTEALPLVHFDSKTLPSAIGKSTEAALQSGVFWGAVGGLRELIERIAANLPEEPEVFLTGGGADLFVDHLSRPARFVPHLVLSGIARAHALSLPSGAEP